MGKALNVSVPSGAGLHHATSGALGAEQNDLQKLEMPIAASLSCPSSQEAAKRVGLPHELACLLEHQSQMLTPLGTFQLEGCQQLLRDGLKPLDNRLDVLVNNAGRLALDTRILCRITALQSLLAKLGAAHCHWSSLCRYTCSSLIKSWMPSLLSDVTSAMTKSFWYFPDLLNGVLQKTAHYATSWPSRRLYQR